MITIKSTLDGLEFWIDSNARYAEIKEDLFQKLHENKSFYRGTKLPAIFFGKHFTELQKRELTSYLQHELGIKKTTFSDEEPDEQSARPANNPVVSIDLQEASQSGAIFVQRTVRNGQRIEHEGDVVIIGDVNSGAEIIAGGSIAVFGKLRGLAHAGAQGRQDVCIVANQLLPKQVRIGGKIAIIPEDREIEGTEIVRLEDDKIVVDTLN